VFKERRARSGLQGGRVSAVVCSVMQQGLRCACQRPRRHTFLPEASCLPYLLAAGRHDLADSEWCVLEPLLPRGKKAGRPPKWARRQLINGIRWRTRTGSPWRDVPAAYGPWQSAYGLFRRWQRDGTWRTIIREVSASRPSLVRLWNHLVPPGPRVPVRGVSWWP
jgi:transposase